MKTAIKEFLDLTDTEKKQLWDEAIFVFDTNVLLNLYRYSANTRNSLFKAFDSLNGRVWIPYQVALEYMKNRYEIIHETVQRYDTLESEGKKLVGRMKELLRLNADDKELLALEEYLKKWLNKNKQHNLLVTNFSDDEILEKVLALFDGKVGEEISEEELEEIKKEGAKRYKKSIPPGYKDAGKQKEQDDNNAYGDLIIWKQIIKYATENNKDIIFVTSDQKEDWWYVAKGKTIGPRFELKKEFHKETNKLFHMYKMESFINTYNSLSAKKIEKSVVDEIATYEKNMNSKRVESGPLHVTPLRLKKQLAVIDRKLEQCNKELFDLRFEYMKSEEAMPKDIEKQCLELELEKVKLQSQYFSILDRIEKRNREERELSDKQYITNRPFISYYYKDNE